MTSMTKGHRPPATMADIEAYLPSLDCSTAAKASLRAAIRKGCHAYGEPDLARISADPEAFRRMWSRVETHSAFRSGTSFRHWCSRVRAALEHCGQTG